MTGQMSLFDFVDPQVKPGEWLQESQLGKEITFDEIARSVGKVIAIDKSTQSHTWYKAVLIEKILERDEYVSERAVDRGRASADLRYIKMD